MEEVSRKPAYAFVLPRYFSGIAGGAETLAGSLARDLAKRGCAVEIFTTCAKDNRTWENFFPAGKSIEEGVTVRRFRVDDRNLDIWIPKQIAISQGMRLSVDDQLDWMREGVNSTALYEEILRRESEFEKIFFAPYLFSTTFWGSLMLTEKAVLIPCLHDENYAYLDVIASMFRQVKGCLFNSLPEKELAYSLYGEISGGEVGMGFEAFSEEYLLSLKNNFEIDSPYLLYIGRKETGKNVQLLIDYFIYAKDYCKVNPALKLVIAGGGDFKDLHRESALTRNDIVDIAHLTENDKHALMKGALIFCQPSLNESFSIVIMESWLLGVPCLVHGDCAVTSYHVSQSGGGLYFTNEREFSEVLRLISHEKDLVLQMGCSGADYVKRQYSWDAVFCRFQKALECIAKDSNISQVNLENL